MADLLLVCGLGVRAITPEYEWWGHGCDYLVFFIVGVDWSYTRNSSALIDMHGLLILFWAGSYITRGCLWEVSICTYWTTLLFEPSFADVKFARITLGCGAFVWAEFVVWVCFFGGVGSKTHVRYVAVPKVTRLVPVV